MTVLSGQNARFEVRVLLDSVLLQDAVEWQINAPQGFIVHAVDDPTVVHETQETSMSIKIARNKLYLNNKRLAFDKIKISPRGEKSVFNQHSYVGDWLLIVDQKHVYLINTIDLEDYVYSVLRWESWPGWPLEVNKVFAIVCRTYVIAKIAEHRGARKKLPYDIKATNVHQTYKGHHEFEELWQAIEQTRGIVLAHKGKAIIAMYDCCCGGIIPAHIKGVNFKEAPYLARNYACTYCAQSKLFNWHIEYQVNDFERLLEKNYTKKIKIKDIKVSKKDKAGVVHELDIGAPTGLKITGKKMYTLCKDIKSYVFTVVKKAQKIIIRGKGYGHHLGLCQWGSRQMVREGWDYKSILHFFYPHVTFMQVQHTL